jgi:hypothetical protein
MKLAQSALFELYIAAVLTHENDHGNCGSPIANTADETLDALDRRSPCVLARPLVDGGKRYVLTPQSGILQAPGNYLPGFAVPYDSSTIYLSNRSALVMRKKLRINGPMLCAGIMAPLISFPIVWFAPGVQSKLNYTSAPGPLTAFQTKPAAPTSCPVPHGGA